MRLNPDRVGPLAEAITIDRIRNAYQRGKSDAERGISYTRCPYAAFELEAAWYRGFEYVREKMLRASK